MDKPAGPTSHDVVARVRRALRTRAVGHTGTLDPFATGLLVVLSGRATRLARYVEQQPKTYLATARLGERTDTDDATGVPMGGTGPAEGEPPSRDQVVAALGALTGHQRQRPPAYSAKRVGGERSYRKARRGETVELGEVDIVVHSMELVGYDYPELTFRCTVSPGTYIRALARDLGDRLGPGAHLTALRREAIGGLRVEQAVSLDSAGPEALVPPLAVLGHLPRVDVSEDDADALGYGRAVAGPPDGGDSEGGPLAVTCGDRLVAIARRREGRLAPELVLEAQGG